MSALFRFAQRAQRAADWLPLRWRLPLRYGVQKTIGGLEPELALLPSLVPAGSIALDVGANMGVYSYALATLASHVHAFEPQAECCRVIEAWGSGRNVTVHNAGIGSRPGELVLHVPIIDGRAVGTRASFTAVDGPHEDIRVPVITIDGLQIERVGFMKIDVEGFEHDVLLGAVATLRRYLPTLLIELDRKRHTRESFQRTVDFLAELGYGASAFVEGRLQACGDSVWETAKEHYNFIFTATRLGADPQQLPESIR